MAQAFSYLLDCFYENLSAFGAKGFSPSEKSNLYILWECLFPQINECETIENKRVAAWRRRKKEPEALAREFLGLGRSTKEIVNDQALVEILDSKLQLDSNGDGTLFAIAVDACWPYGIARGASTVGTLSQTDLGFLFSEEFSKGFSKTLRADFLSEESGYTKEDLTNFWNWIGALRRDIDTFQDIERLHAYIVSLMLASLVGPRDIAAVFPDGDSVRQTVLRGGTSGGGQAAVEHEGVLKLIPVSLGTNKTKKGLVELSSVGGLNISTGYEGPRGVLPGLVAHIGTQKWDEGLSIVIPRDEQGNSMVSREHACIRQGANGAWLVQDMGSTNGSLVLHAAGGIELLLKSKSKKLEAELSDGDLIVLAPVVRGTSFYADSWSRVFRVEFDG